MLKTRLVLAEFLEDMVKAALFPIGDSRGPPNHHMGPLSERRHEQSSGPEHGPDRGPFRGGQDCRGPPDRRGPHPDFPDDFNRPDDFHPDKRFGHRLREFEGRGGPLPQEEKWRRGGPGPPFPPDHREFSEGDGRGSARGPPGTWEGRRPGDERFPRDPEDPRFRGRREERWGRYCVGLFLLPWSFFSFLFPTKSLFFFTSLLALPSLCFAGRL